MKALMVPVMKNQRWREHTLIQLVLTQLMWRKKPKLAS